MKKNCCKDSTVTLKMLDLFNKKQIYDNVSREKKTLLKIWNYITSMTRRSCNIQYPCCICYFAFLILFVTRSGFLCWRQVMATLDTHRLCACVGLSRCKSLVTGACVYFEGLIYLFTVANAAVKSILLMLRFAVIKYVFCLRAENRSCLLHCCWFARTRLNWSTCRGSGVATHWLLWL